jgi:mono/diheme cytochrome c family protein
MMLSALLCALLGCTSDSTDDPAGDAGGDSALTRGAAAVKARDCGMCHAAADKSLSGSTTPRSGTMAYPANLTPDDTGIGSWSEVQIQNATLNGVDDEDATLCAIMPRFSTLGMKQAEAADIAAYLKSLAPVAHEIPESTCPEKN